MRCTVTNPLRTVANIRAWVGCETSPPGTKGAFWTSQALDKEVLWWFACWQAKEWGDLRTKDIANILLQGLPPLTLAMLQEELDSAHESEDESEPAARQIEAHLRRHFGLATNDEDEE